MDDAQLTTSSHEAYDDYFVDYKSIMEEVVILEGPSSGFVTRSKAFTVSCKALNSRHIRFKCNERWIDQTRVSETFGTDPSSQMPFLNASFDIARPEVEPSAEFFCECYASRTPDSEAIRSKPAKIETAYMRKHFHTTPQSQRVHEGLTVQLQCAPPESEPRAQIEWLKNGKLIERGADPNIIHGKYGIVVSTAPANDGSLIFSAARLADSGSYVCEASNIATKRSSDPADLAVYVDGGWSEWSEYEGSCIVDCSLLQAALATGEDGLMPRKRRTRTCNNPAPLNGGASCSGIDEQFEFCDVDCKIDGRWSDWTPWSDCNDQCLQARTRKCSFPPPMNGGAECFGPSNETQTCPAPCKIKTPEQNSPTAPTTSIGLSTQDLPLLIGMCSIFLLLAIILITLCWLLVCRKSKNKKGSSAIYYAEANGHLRRALLDPQSGTLLKHELGKLPPELYAASPIHPTMTMRSAKSGYSAYASTRNAGSRAALITECSSNSSSERGRKTILRSSSGCSEDENYATLYDCLDEKSVQSIQSAQSFLVAQIDEAGARFSVSPAETSAYLQLKKCGASLLVPERAVDCERRVYLAVSEKSSDKPRLPPGEVALSAVVSMGESEWDSDAEARVLRKPAVLSFRHCAATFPRDNWAFAVWANDGFGWRKSVIVGEENLNSPLHVHLEPPAAGRLGMVHVMSEHFGSFMLTGRARRSSIPPCKRVRLACFGPDRPTRDDFELRVYCVPETGAAMECVEKQEAGMPPLASSPHFLLQPAGDLCFCIEEISPGFQQRGAPIVEIPPASHQWCAQNGLHCSIPILNSERRRPEEFNCRLVVYQKTNNAERHVLNIQLDVSGVRPDEQPDKVVDISFQLPPEIKDRLAELLDPPTDPSKDWRGLAAKLKLDKYLQAVESDSIRAIADLQQHLRVMGRPDACHLLEPLLAPPLPSPPPSISPYHISPLSR